MYFSYPGDAVFGPFIQLRGLKKRSAIAAIGLNEVSVVENI
jgi:hypothetical protein